MITRFSAALLAATSAVLLVGETEAQTYQKVYDFFDARQPDVETTPTRGSSPRSTLIQGSDGSFYGTTSSNGAYGLGTVFNVTSAGVVTTLVDFTGNNVSNKGSSPYGGLVQGSDGNFYGTTNSGGAGGYGTVFKMTSAGVLTTLVEFTSNGTSNKGSYPYAGLIQGSDGNFYGTTNSGGAGGYGTVFKMTPAGVLTTLVEFTGNGTGNKGSNPYAGLIQASDGNFYGTTYSGGANSFGTIFKMTASGTLTTLVEFAGSGFSNKGSFPQAPLVQASDGFLYGTTTSGGVSGGGTVFRIASFGGPLSTVVEFNSGVIGSSNPYFPYAPLVQGNDGNLYGTTYSGGSGGNGTAYRLTPGGTLTVVVEFTGNGAANKGASPYAGLVQGSDGNLYGTTTSGGANFLGTAFKMTTAGALTTLVEFTGSTTSSKGTWPRAELAQGNDGNFYGTTYSGGSSDGGTIFRLTPGGVVSTLVEFTGNGASNKGRLPYAGLTQGSDGNFYGTTSAGGSSGRGTVFRMTLGGALTTLIEFTGNGTSNKGSTPIAKVIQASDGNFYGTTYRGGGNDYGTVFRLTSAGALTTLVEFTGNGVSNKGRLPYAGLVQGSDGNFYGNTEFGGANDYGTIFKMTPAGVLSTLVEFTGNSGINRGLRPEANLVQGSDGNFYGTTLAGGSSFLGTLFKMTPAGALTVLVDFTGNGASNKGRDPYATLLQGADGNFYGATSFGGTSNFGTVFKVTPAGVLTTLVDFTNQKDGNPYGGLIRDSAGVMYGTTGYGAGGSIYQLITVSAPDISAITAVAQDSTSALVSAQVNPNGATTAVSVEYGTDGTTFPSSASVGNLSGSTAQSVSVTLTGLTATTQYYYRIRAQNSAGTTVSTVQSFTTPSPPQAVVGTATVTSPTAATISGLVDPKGFSTTVSFEISTNPAFSLPATVAATPSPVSGSGAVAVSASLQGLTAGTTYYFRVVATSLAGSTTSSASSFTTGSPPVLTAAQATGIGATEATFSGTANANGPTTTVIFEYGTDGSTFPNSLSANPASVSGNSVTPVTATVAGLSAGTTYYYRVRGTSSAGTSVSPNVVQFSTLLAPSATTGGAGDITASRATLSGTINANGTSTSAVFDYGTDGVVFPFSVLGTPSTVTGTGGTMVTAVLDVLSENTTYYFRLRGVSDGGTSTGAVLSFTTLQLPLVNTGAVENVSILGATVRGTVNARGSATSVSLDLSRFASFITPSSFAAVPSTVNGNVATAVTVNLGSLLPATRYYYRFRATSAAGTVTSSPESFVTPSQPIVTVSAATNVMALSAQLNGTVDAGGASTTAVFEYATNSAFTGSSTVPASQSPLSGVGAAPVTVLLPGLAEGTTYYYRVVATSGGGTATSSTVSFTTPSLPVVTVSAPTDIGSSSATFRGTAKANGPATTVTFEYGTDGSNFPGSLSASPATVTGTIAVAVSAAAGGLVPGTVYYYRVRGTSSAGTALSSTVAQVTTLTAPSAITGVAGNVTASSATLSGTINANGSTTAATFEYGTDGINFPFGIQAVPSSVTGSSNTTVNATVSGLAEETTYFYRVRASSAAGTAFGDAGTFATLRLPSVVTGQATGVSVAGATLNGTVNARGTSTSVTAEVTTDVAFSNVSTVPVNPSPITGENPVAVTASLTSLPPGATYFFRFRATSAAGTAIGSVQSFTTPSAPVATVGAATISSSTTATVSGTVNANGTSTAVSFQIATNTAFTSPVTVTATPSPLSGVGAVAVSASLQGLTEGGTYYFRVVATSAGGTATSSAANFIMPSRPVLTAAQPNGIGATLATFNGTANAVGLATAVAFEYGTDGTTFPSSLSATPASVSGNSVTPVTATVAGLSAGTTYYYRVRGTSSAGTNVSPNVVQFSTLVAPSATTGTASGITANRATISGTVNANGTDTSAIFDYGTDGVVFPFSVLGTPATATGTGSTTVSAVLDVLSENTTYYFRLRGLSEAGTSAGAVQSFTTLQLPLANTGGAENVSILGATLRGTVNARGSATTVTVEVAGDAFFTTPASLAATPSTVSGNTVTAVSVTLAALPPATRYYYRFRATSAAGTVASSPETFVTPSQPVVAVRAATNVMALSAQLNGTVDAGGAVTSAVFEYATNSAFTNSSTVLATQSPLSGVGPTPVTVLLPGLAEATTYYYRVLGSSGGGNATSSALSFTTTSLPSVTVLAPVEIGSDSATFQGTAKANGPVSNISFEYGTDGTTFPGSVSAVPASVNGATVVTVTAAVGGLAPGTLYYYRVRGTSSAGTALSPSVAQFTTLTAPTVVTGVAGVITATTASVSGTINANGSTTAAGFEYGTDGVNFPFGVPGVPASMTGSLNTTVNATLSGLAENTTYYFRARASSVAGTAVGDAATFTTLRLPAVVTGPATAVSIDGATLSGSVNARGTSTSVSVEVATDLAFSTPSTFSVNPSPVAGENPVAVTASLTSLPPSTTYFYRFRAVSAAGEAVGITQTFTTPSQPVVTVAAATNVTAASAQLNGTVNAKASSTSVVFEYATSAAFTNPSIVTAIPSSIAGTDDVPVIAQVTGLQSGTAYYFRIKATSIGGTVTGSGGEFTTLLLPVVSGLATTNLGSQSVTLNANVNPGGVPATVVFEYGPSQTVFPFSVVATPGTVSGSGNAAVNANVTGLEPETSYYFRVRSVSAAGETVTSALNFTTAPSGRAVTGAGSATLADTDVKGTLNGTVNGFGLPTSVFFDYGTDAANLTTSVPAVPGSLEGTSDVTVSATVPGLSQGQTYYFRVKVSNNLGTTRGSIQSFTTPTKRGLIGRDDYIFYAGGVIFDPLRNDDDPDANPPGDKRRLTIDPVLVQAPTVSKNVARVVQEGKAIDYRPQFNVQDVDTLIYRVRDGFGGEATPTVSLITFGSRAGFYGGSISDPIKAPGGSGAISLQLGSIGAITVSFANWRGENYRLKGQFDQYGELVATFTPADNPTVVLTLRLALDHVTKTIQGSLVERTNNVQTAQVPAFTLTMNAGTGGLPESGMRTAFLSAPSDATTPMGDGYIVLTVPKNRKSGRFVGRLPDGEPLSVGAPSQGRAFSLKKRLERSGLLTGLVRMTGATGAETGMMGDLFWEKRAAHFNEQSQFTRSAVETNLTLLGVNYPTLSRSDVPPIALGTGAPNAILQFAGGDLPTTLEFPLTIQPGSVTGFDTRMLQLKLQPWLGLFSGTFRHPVSGKSVNFRGAFRVPFDSEPGQGRGSFTVPNASGSVHIGAP